MKSLCISTPKTLLETSLIDERRALQILLVKCRALFKHYPTEWIQTRINEIHELRRKADDEIITFHGSTNIDWNKRINWFTQEFKLDMPIDERRIFWLSNADAEDFSLEHTTYSDYLDSTDWIALGKGITLGDESTKSDRIEENVKTKDTMNDILAKMREARLRKICIK